MAWVKVGVTLQDCEVLATRLRSEDLKEIRAVKPGKEIVKALHDCVTSSHKNYAVMEEGLGCIAIFGISKATSQDGIVIGVPWLLCSEELFGRSCRKFIRHCKSYVRELTDGFNYCFNYVATTNLKAHHWLVWMGFNLLKTTPKEINGVSFYPFNFIRNDSV